MREPLLLPLIAIAAGILLGQYAAFEVRESLWPALALAAMACAPVSLWLRRIATALALLFAGAFLVAAHRPSREPLLLVDGRVPGTRETVTASGCVVEPTVLSSDGARFTLELDAGARALVHAPQFALKYGQRVEIEGRFRAPRSFLNPGAFDYAAYLARRDTYWTALVPSQGSVRVLPGVCGVRWRGWVFALRTAALDRIESLYPNNPYAAAMLEAFLIGESANLEKVWTEDFRRSGTYHALVISGLHVSVLAGCLLALLRFLMPLNGALAITAAAAWLYALVSGFSAPVVRAAAGFTLYLIARMLYRRVRPLNLLSTIAIAYLAWDPQQLFEASFQLSFLSVAAIGAFAAPWLEKTTGPLAHGMRGIHELNRDPHLDPRAAQFRVELRLAAETLEYCLLLPRKIGASALATAARFYFAAVELTTISLCIQVGLALPMAIYFHRISFTGLSANLLIVPLMNLLVPVGFFAIFTNAHWAADLADTLLRWSSAIAKWHANIEPAWRVPDPPVLLSIALLMAILAGAILLRRNRLRWPALATVAALLILLIRSPWPAEAVPGMLELTAIDVGQGDSLLLVFPQGATMLIDGGGRLEYGARPQRRSNLDIGEDVVSTYLWSRGIRHIDVIAATHAHQDHIGGLRALIENFHPTELWTGANPLPALVAQAKRQGVSVHERETSVPFPFSGATIEVLAPAEGYVPSSPGNNDSLVLRVTYGERSLLLTGDLERAEESRLLEQGRRLKADVLKVGHHGSKTSTTQAFLDAVAPSIAVISAGYENSFGHPHPDVLARLNERHTTILRTDRFGLATVRTDGQRLTYNIEAWDTQTRRRLWNDASRGVEP